ncbi:ABC transporter permease [Metamycoplasma neophronis]|uniref:ABC transporter permease n=1 Tax=Metamycoplasma neophronis TaxID=872983 RepID=A0ABY2Z0Z5_9BACT|nr:ABC transporter permease [Metamycoplasma neophronis]TPR54715.1 ABC transporter permease [Metamycoplasma neophronis]
MKKSLANYSNFIFKIAAKKKSTLILPILEFVISLILAITLFSVKLNAYYKTIVIYAYTLVTLLLGVLYSSLKGLNIFKDLEQEGIELLTFAKPISRKSIIGGKFLCFFELGLIWSLCTLISGALVYSSLASGQKLVTLIILSFFVQLFNYLLFGIITILISYKLSQKFALAIPLLIFTPLAIGGAFMAANATSKINNAGYYLNTKYEYHKSNTVLDAEKFYLNNNKDEFFIMPNGNENKSFSKEQIEYLNKVMEITKKAATNWQAYSWLAIPYQMLDIFNIDNETPFTLNNNDKNNLENYINYKKLESVIYNYKLDTKPNLLNLPVNYEGKIVNKYFVPGVLKDYSHIPNLVNTSVIYARENASEFDSSFQEDNYVYASPRNLVGEIKWNNLKDVLSNTEFNEFAANFFKNIDIKFTQNPSLNEMLEAKTKLLDTISKEVNDKNSKLYSIDDKNIAVFDKYAVKNNKLASETERKIYLVSALLNYLYFAGNQGNLIKSLLKSPSDKNTYQASQIKIQVDNYKYLIGGFESYEAKSKVVNDKVVIRYDLTPSNTNYLFQDIDSVYSIKRNGTVVNKWFYFLIWVGLIIILSSISFNLYLRKDYK